MVGERVRHDRAPLWRSRWATPAFSLLLGGVIFAAFAVSGDVAAGARAFAVMAVVAAVFVAGARSETLRGLGGPGRDERWALIDTRANALTGLVVIGAVIVLWLYEIARGEDGSPYGELIALAGVTYIAAVVWLHRRS